MVKRANLKYLGLTLVVLFFFHWALVKNRPKSSFSTPWVLTDPDITSKVIVPAGIEMNYTKEPDRANACFVVLIRNSDLHNFRPTMRQLEDRFNRKYNYPYVFLNDVPFTEEFKKYTSALTKAKTEYGLIPYEYWSVPDYIDMGVVKQNMEKMESEGVLYGAFTVSLYEYQKTIPTLWDAVKEFALNYPEYIEPDNLMEFVSKDNGKSYN
ncbi:4127_t:CDS:2, partial [Dentiscutata heterogama]